MVYGGSETYRAVDADREFESAELYAGSRAGRFVVRSDGSDGFYVTVLAGDDEGEQYHVIPQTSVPRR